MDFQVPVLDVKELWKRYGGLEILRGIDLTLNEGERLIIIGPSGGGKSTLLRCIMGLENISRGQVLFRGDSYIKRLGKRTLVRKDLQLKIGMVFQRFNLFPHLSVIDNLVLAPNRVRHMELKEAREKGYELLRRFRLEHKANEYPSRLSGGESQRVAIVRALMMEPEVMLFDEITSALDPELVGEVLNVLAELAAQGMSMIIVTHELGFAMEVGSRILFMDGGKIEEEGPVERILCAPEKARTREFLKHFAKKLK